MPSPHEDHFVLDEHPDTTYVGFSAQELRFLGLLLELTGDEETAALCHLSGMPSDNVHQLQRRLDFAQVP